MTTTFTLRPELMLTACDTIAPHRVTPPGPTDVEAASGAIGCGSMLLPDGTPVLVLSVHMADGDTRMALLDADATERFMRLLEEPMLSCMAAQAKHDSGTIN